MFVYESGAIEQIDGIAARADLLPSYEGLVGTVYAGRPVRQGKGENVRGNSLVGGRLSYRVKGVLEIGGTFDRQALVVPAFQLGSTNELQFRFEIPPVESSRCRDTVLVSQASIDADSTIDLRNLEHYATLPNLAMYANSGFPFTKYADLAETALVLPDQPDAQVIETALGLLGQMGAATGVAGTRVQVIGASQVKSVADRDLLVIATGQTPAPLDGWRQSLPSHLDAGSRGHAPLTRFSDTASEWFTGALPRKYPGSAWAEWKTAGPLAALMAFESPLAAGRSARVGRSNSNSGCL